MNYRNLGYITFFFLLHLDKSFFQKYVFLVSAWRAQEQFDNTKLYDVLELDKDATLDDIKKAYRSLSKKYHPDKNKSEDAGKKFEEIAEAYGILSDSEKRRVYDTQGYEAAKNLESRNMDDHADHYNSFFEGFFGGGGGGFGGREDDNRKADSLLLNVELNLEQLYNGELFNIFYTREISCLRSDECIEKNRECSGKGYKTVTQQVAPGFIMQNKVRDPSCIARGQSWKYKCQHCPNGMKEKNTIKLTLEIEKGSRNNDKIVFEKKGKQEIGYEHGDLIFVVQTKKHSTYERKNNDLYQNYEISLKEALVGFNRNLDHISGSPVNVNKQTVTFHNEVLKIKNKGMPIKSTDRYGDLYIKFFIQFPKKLTEEQKKVLSEIL